MLGDPRTDPEAAFEEAAIAGIRSRLDRRAGAGLRYDIIQRFGLDTIVLILSGERLELRLLEFKAYAGQRMGGVGFGNQRGRGPQVDLLMLPDDLLASLTPYVRWCFADLTRLEDERRYSVITCWEAKRAAMGGVGRGKQNNFRIKDALHEPLAWGEMLDRVEGFLARD